MGLTREWDPVDRGFRVPGSRRVQVPYKYPKLAAYREAPKEPCDRDDGGDAGRRDDSRGSSGRVLAWGLRDLDGRSATPASYLGARPFSARYLACSTGVSRLYLRFSEASSAACRWASRLARRAT